jgi:cation diffusion facilitator CzcD-associated flavoprotein CzcO
MTAVAEPPAPSTGAERAPAHVDVAIVGAGFSGIGMAVALRRSGRRDFALLERGTDVGGTWRDNTYPGCACDVPSHLYSFSFAPNPEWSSTFSPQPEIHAYLRRVAEREGVLEHVRLGCEVREAAWDEAAGRWRIETSTGAVTARVLIAAAGALNEPSIPDVPGLREFPGTIFHSAEWDHEHDLDGERVAVIGTGASAIQFVPAIQPRVGRLHLFQRTPPWITPRRARPLTRVERAVYRRLPAAQKAMRAGIYWAREAFALPMLHARIAGVIEAVARAHLKQQVPDPELRAKLTPDYKPGCKRILISNDYLPALAQPNVEVVTDGIAELRGRTIVARDGSEREVDTIVLGTGFHVTDLPIADRVRGRDGRTLAEHWGGSLQGLRGTTVAGFPNLFFLLGPNTGLGHTSVMVMAEAQIDYVMRALDFMRAGGVDAVDPRPEAQRAWNERIDARMRGTVWMSGGCESWYRDRTGRISTLWPDFTFRFRRELRRFDPGEYRLVRRAPAAEPARAPAVAAA